MEWNVTSPNGTLVYNLAQTYNGVALVAPQTHMHHINEGGLSLANTSTDL